MNAGNKNTPSMHHPRRWNVTTSMVGLRNGHICKILTKNGEPRGIAEEHRRRRMLIVKNEFSISVNKPRRCGKIPNSTQINYEISLKMTAKDLISHTPVALNEGQDHLNWYQSIQFSSLYYQLKFERNLSVFLLVFFLQNHMSRVLSLEHRQNKI